MAYFVLVRWHDSVPDFVPFTTRRFWKLGRMNTETYYGPYTLRGALRVQRRVVGADNVSTCHGANPAPDTVGMFAVDSTDGVYSEITTRAPYGARRNMPRGES